MDVVKNQMSIPTYEKPMMEVMELEIEGALLGASDMTNVTTNVITNDDPVEPIGNGGSSPWNF